MVATVMRPIYDPKRDVAHPEGKLNRDPTGPGECHRVRRRAVPVAAARRRP